MPDQLEYCHLYLTDISKPFENWMVLGRTGGGIEDIGFTDIGFRIGKEYLVFEFWAKEFLGVFLEKLEFPAIDTTFKCQAFCIREKQGHPQVLATGRHVTCGGYDLEDVAWKNRTLNGTSKLVGNDPYDIYIYEPEGFEFSSFECIGAEVSGNSKAGNVRVISLVKDLNGDVTWRSVY